MPSCSQELSLQAGAGPVTGSDLHDRLGSLFDGNLTACPARHARGGRGIIGKIDGSHVRHDSFNIADELVG